MATLPENDRLRIMRGLMRYWSANRETTNFVKADLKAAIDAIDLFMDNNAAALNSALPQPFRGNATTEQKAVLLAAIVAMRYTQAFLRRLFGEVD